MEFDVKLLAIILMLCWSQLTLAAGKPSEFLGHWLFHKMIYKGQLMDPLNPQLIMTFTFHEVGVNTLSFHRLDEEGFCERTAVWFYHQDKQELHQKVTWANPNNRSDCAQDPDFQIGHESFSPFNLVEDQLHLTVPLADENVIFVWKRLP